LGGASGRKYRRFDGLLLETAMQGSAVFNGVFELREGVSEEEFLPTLKAFTRTSSRWDSHPDIAF